MAFLDLDVTRNYSRFVLLLYHSTMPMFKQFLGHCSLVTLHIIKQCWNIPYHVCSQAYSIFGERYGNDALYPVNVFKSARLFNTTKVYELQSIAADVDELSAFPFRTGELDQLKEELPTYVCCIISWS